MSKIVVQVERRKGNDGLGFLQIAEASLRIREHMDLFLWLQGDVQRVLPHEVLIAAWGDFGAKNVSFDVISPLPRLRTEALYVSCHCKLSGPDVTAGSAETTGVKKHSTAAFLVSMRDRWHSVGCTPYVALRTEGDETIDFICPHCDSEAAKLLNNMQSSLVHGFSDQRGRLECIYVFLSTKELSDPVFRRSLRFLLPYLDNSLRQVSHLPIQAGENELIAADRDDSGESTGLSQREAEIMDWVRIGKTNYEIGLILNISAFTVKNHLQRIFKKLDASSRAQAVDKLGRWKTNA